MCDVFLFIPLCFYYFGDLQGTSSIVKAFPSSKKNRQMSEPTVAAILERFKVEPDLRLRTIIDVIQRMLWASTSIMSRH